MSQQTVSLKRGRLSDEVYDLIRDRILRGEYAPGDRLVESEIARSLEVSQSPVRDALAKLAHEGAVLQFPRRGTYVADISTEKALDAYAVRIPLERVAVEQFMKHATPEVFQALEDALAAMVAAAERDDLAGLVAADADFHRIIWEATENETLSKVWGLVGSTMRNLTLVSNRLYFTDLTQIAETHRPLLAALRAADSEAADMFVQHARAVWKSIGRDSESGS